MTPQKAALLRTRLKGLARKVNAAYLLAWTGDRAACRCEQP
jgi:hypothetical protein